LYAEPIYLQAERSPMPELRLVVLALQDRLAYGPTFETAMAGLFGQSVPALQTPAAAQGRGQTPANASAPAPEAISSAAPDALIRDAARDLAEYQRLTAEGKLGEAGQHLESLKQKLDQLQRAQRR
jgi:uncharacterized membrane protein (UPF0182 family)